MTTSSCTNEYLKLREEKMARNRNKLERLGLAGPYNKWPSSEKEYDDHDHNPTHHDAPKSQTKRDTFHHRKHNTKEVTPTILRRSSRVKNIVSYEEGRLESTLWRKRELISSDHQHKNQRKRKDETNTTHSLFPSMQKPLNVSKERSSEIKPGTTRSISISILSTLYGKPRQNESMNHDNTNNNHDTSFIGQYLTTPNKSSVIEHANYYSGNPPGISFNKYSGVCEFSNAIFLWVNIGAKEEKEDGVVNEFLNGGRQMTWYGGSRMTNESPVIQRLIQLGKESKLQYEKDESHWNSHEYNKGIILWCRLNDASMKGKYTPYICMGRLGYHSHEVDSYPVKFVWDLLDYNELMQSKKSTETNDENTMSAFERLLLM